MWTFVTVIISLQFNSLEVPPSVGVHNRFKDEASCLLWIDDLVKKRGFKYKINSQSGQKYISKVDSMDETLGFCERITGT